MKSEKDDTCEDFSDEATREKIIKDCRDGLGKDYEQKKIYLISKKDKETYTTDDDDTVTFLFPDNELLKKDLLEELPVSQRQSLGNLLECEQT